MPGVDFQLTRTEVEAFRDFDGGRGLVGAVDLEFIAVARRPLRHFQKLDIDHGRFDRCEFRGWRLLCKSRVRHKAQCKNAECNREEVRREARHGLE
ncbi:MAG: hypothetical protein WDN48_05545 [Pseudolabrys sp.]